MTTATPVVYADILRPATRSRAIFYDAALVIAGSLLIALSARVAIPIPFSPLPITGQTMVVLLLGALLGRKRAIAAVGAYILEGAAGLPVFTAGAGAAYLVGPSGGYLLGFFAAAGLTGALAERGWDRRPLTAACAMAAGNAALYLFGVAWLSVFLGIEKAFMAGAVVFIPGDLMKIALAASLLPLGWKLTRREQ